MSIKAAPDTMWRNRENYVWKNLGQLNLDSPLRIIHMGHRGNNL